MSFLLGHTGRSEDIFGRAKTICLRDANREPDNAKDKIQHHHGNPKPENTRIHPWRQIIDSYRQNKQTLRHSPDKGSPSDIVVSDTARESYVPYYHLRHNKIGDGLIALLEKICVAPVGNTWQLLAANVIQDVQDHQATMNPKNRAYFGPALSAAQM